MDAKPTPTLLLLTTLVATACDRPPEPVPMDDAALEASVQAFHQARVEELAAPDSWLSLIALHWIEEGETTLGSDPSNDLVLPEGKAAPFVGKVVLEDGTGTFYANRGVRVTLGVDSTLDLSGGSGAIPPDISKDPAVTEAEMGSAGPGKFKVLRNGPINWILIRRGDRYALRVRDNESEVYDRFHGIDRYPTDPALRVTARWVPQEKTVAVPNVLGTVAEVSSPAYLEFWVDGERQTLDVTGNPDSDRFMLVFADATSGKETYGGGRYLWVDGPDDQNRVVIDFNKAYNPPCVWTEFATCSLPTRDNRLAVAIEAGEKNWGH